MPGKQEVRKPSQKSECVDKALKQLPSKNPLLPKKGEIVVNIKAKENISSKAAIITRSLKGLPTSPMPDNL